MAKEKVKEYRENFTNDELLAAIVKVKAKGGTRKDLVKELGLEPKAGYQLVSNALKRFREQGVNIPKLKGEKAPRESRELTAEQVSQFNEALGGEEQPVEGVA